MSIAPSRRKCDFLRQFRNFKGYEMYVNAKKKAVLDRIKHLEEAILKGREYLASGKHASWRGFRPLFSAKVRGGTELPPHRDWVKSVFLPRMERALKSGEKALQKLERGITKHAKDT
jgi:hypothetical protein